MIRRGRLARAQVVFDVATEALLERTPALRVDEDPGVLVEDAAIN